MVYLLTITMKGNGSVMRGDRIDLDSHVIAKPACFTVDKWGRLDTAHDKGIALYPLVDEALLSLSHLFEADSSFLFQPTPGGVLAMEKLFFHTYLHEGRESGRNQFISSVTQEAAILKGLGQMEQLGCGVKLIPVDDQGKIDLKAFEAALTPKTALVSLAAVCPITGVMQPIEPLIDLCHARQIKVHLNVTHAIGSWGVSLQEWRADYLSFDGDKIGTTSGMGGLFSREVVFTEIHPHMILDIAQAIELKTLHQEQFAMECARRRWVFETELKRLFPEVKILAEASERAPHILAIHFPGVFDESLLYFLFRHRIDASIGGGPFQTVKALLKAMGMKEGQEYGGVSLALTSSLQEDDLAYALDTVVKGVHKLKKIGGYSS
ncbi:MAG: aminotransferase class V-fold PLP-dependent enzyme [Candidatus Rhabdochlamydia sp.]